MEVLSCDLLVLLAINTEDSVVRYRGSQLFGQYSNIIARTDLIVYILEELFLHQREKDQSCVPKAKEVIPNRRVFAASFLEDLGRVRLDHWQGV